MHVQLLDDLRRAVGAEHVLTEPDVVAGYTRDWTGRWQGACLCVVRPASTAEVAAVVRACASRRTALVPQGGNTGLVGGAVPATGQVLLSLTRMDTLDPVDVVASQLTVDAGVPLAALQHHARAAGLDFAVDLTARDTATVGGMTATNAGGVHLIRYGGMRQQVTGIEAVLPSGEVVSRLDGLLKDNSGYDLAGLLCGSEGTLAVITRVRVRLVPHLEHRLTALLALPSTDAAMVVITRLRPLLPSLEAAEITFGPEIELIVEHTDLPRPFDPVPPVCLLIECVAREDPTDELAVAIDACPEVIDSAVASDAGTRERLWAWREHHSEVVQRLGIPHKLDVTLPLGRLAAFESAVRAELHRLDPTLTVVMWGHVGDGNLHVNVVGRPPDDETVDDTVLALVARSGGSISAEHGIGRAKKRWLPLTRSPADLAAMAAVRGALDPDRILNPDVLF